MGKVNQLWREQLERRFEEYMAAHPDADAAEAWDALEVSDHGPH